MINLDTDFIQACNSDVAPALVQRMIQVESKGNPLAINVNSRHSQVRQPPASTKAQAIAFASQLIAQGYSVDLGLMQINSQNLKPYGIAVAQAFDACMNIHVGGRILEESYQRALKKYQGNHAILASLSAYNTGHFTKGLHNGYVNRCTRIQPNLNSNQADTRVDF